MPFIESLGSDDIKDEISATMVPACPAFGLTGVALAWIVFILEKAISKGMEDDGTLVAHGSTLLTDSQIAHLVDVLKQHPNVVRIAFGKTDLVFTTKHGHKVKCFFIFAGVLVNKLMANEEDYDSLVEVQNTEDSGSMPPLGTHPQNIFETSSDDGDSAASDS